MSERLENLCREICAFMDAPMPPLAADEEGVFAFWITLRDVQVAVSHDPIDHPDNALVHVVFGTPPLHGELAALRDLLAANFEMQLPQAPMFSLNPDTGDVVLRYIHSFSQEPVDALWAQLQALVDAALRWREESAGGGADSGLPITGPGAATEFLAMA